MAEGGGAVNRATAARAVGGIACLALAALAILFARDVWHVENALRDGDARAQTGAPGAGAWSADTTLPFDVARRLLGVRDDIRFRTTLGRAATMTARPSNDVGVRRRLPVKEALLTAEEDKNRVRASEAADTLGVIYSTDPNDPDKPAAEKALEEFVKAVGLDPDNETAKANLELLLRQAGGNGLRGRKGASAGEVPGKSGAGRRAGGQGY
jgi:hypothetical protein